MREVYGPNDALVRMKTVTEVPFRPGPSALPSRTFGPTADARSERILGSCSTAWTPELLGERQAHRSRRT